jgi:DNA replication protein DnaC
MTDWKSSKYWRNRTVEERLRNLRLPPRYKSYTFESYNEDDGSPVFKDAVVKWTTNIEKRMEDGMGLYIHGKTGIGKTHMAVAALKEVVTKNELSGLFMSYDIFVEMVHDARNNDGELPEMYGDPNLLKYMRRVYDVVVFDNLNTDRLTEYMAKTVSNMIESRYEMKLPTIFTTDIIPDKLSVIYSARVQSIIKESCYMMHVVGEDYRTRS